MSTLTTTNFNKIVLEDIPLIDVRAPIEYIKGSFINSINLPILNDEERHLVGTCYKEKGNEFATELGYKLVSGQTKENRLLSWLKFLEHHPNAMIYCFRGGSRSTIAQMWINDISKEKIVKLDGGYKAFRNYLINSLENLPKSFTPIVLTGYTGSGKTILLNKIVNSIDLEGIANHRGSSFGQHPSPQPTQINFENSLAYKLIKHKAKGYKHIIFEDEGRNIGKNFIPKPLTDLTNTGDLVLLDVPLDERIDNTLIEYVILSQKEYIDTYGTEIGIQNWFIYISESIQRLKNKLGGDRFNNIIQILNNSYLNQISTGSYAAHKEWISIFLKEYYDPSYSFALNKSNRKVIFRGNTDEVLSYLNTLK